MQKSIPSFTFQWIFLKDYLSIEISSERCERSLILVSYIAANWDWIQPIKTSYCNILAMSCKSWIIPHNHFFTESRINILVGIFKEVILKVAVLWWCIESDAWNQEENTKSAEDTSYTWETRGHGSSSWITGGSNPYHPSLLYHLLAITVSQIYIM